MRLWRNAHVLPVLSLLMHHSRRDAHICAMSLHYHVSVLLSCVAHPCRVCVMPFAGSALADEAGSSATAAAAAIAAGTYVPSPHQPGWEIWVGAAAGVIPFAIASYEFGKRIVSGLSGAVVGVKNKLKPMGENMQLA